MAQPITEEMFVAADAFSVSRAAVLLVCELRAALAVSVYDDSQGVGGLLHLRYVATNDDQPLDLTDNTLSSDLLLMDRFCKELRSAGARKQSWRVRIVAHTPPHTGMQAPAATVLDLVKAYFSDSRRPIECQELQRDLGVIVRLHAREGHLWVAGTPGTASARLAAPQIL
jgi:chemotaxis receptor (MCP) glutamine deamidase CheD